MFMSGVHHNFATRKTVKFVLDDLTCTDLHFACKTARSRLLFIALSTHDDVIIAALPKQVNNAQCGVARCLSYNRWLLIFNDVVSQRNYVKRNQKLFNYHSFDEFIYTNWRIEKSAWRHCATLPLECWHRISTGWCVSAYNRGRQQFDIRII